MDIQSINNINNNNVVQDPKDMSSIKNIFIYLMLLMAKSVAVCEKNKNATALRSQVLYDRFQEVKEKLSVIKNKMNKEENMYASSPEKLKDIQVEQNDELLKAKALQANVSTLWQVDMSALNNQEVSEMQSGYSAISKYCNNPALRR